MAPMLDAPWKRPPERPEDQIHAEDVCELLGVPLEIALPPNFHKYVYPCALGICSDGEIAFLSHENFADARLRELFGEKNYSQGTFDPALRAMRRDAHSAWRRGLDAFDVFMAISCASEVVRNGALSFHAPSVNLVKDTLVFDGNQHSYDLPALSRPRVVVDYGPGFGGRFVIKEHLAALVQGRPFVYLPISKGPFIDVFIHGFASTLMTKESWEVYTTNGFFASRRDGIFSASNHLASTAPGIGDVVLCSGLQDVDKQELRAGILNAFKILCPGGILFIRSQKMRDPPDSSTVDDMLEIAYEAGFSRKTAHFFHSFAGGVGPGKQPMPTVAVILTR